MCMQAGDVKKTADYVAQVGLCSLLGVLQQICSKGACEVMASPPHSAAHICDTESLSGVNPTGRGQRGLGACLTADRTSVAPMSALCIGVPCASPAALACPMQNNVFVTSPRPVPAAAQGRRRTWPVALAEPAAGEWCKMASSSLAGLPLLAGTLPALLPSAVMLLAWPMVRWPAADPTSRISSFDVGFAIAGWR